MKIEYYVKDVYGNLLNYITDPAVAKHISTLTGRRTLTNRDVTALRGLGFDLVEVVQPR